MFTSERIHRAVYKIRRYSQRPGRYKVPHETRRGEQSRKSPRVPSQDSQPYRVQGAYPRSEECQRIRGRPISLFSNSISRKGAIIASWKFVVGWCLGQEQVSQRMRLFLADDRLEESKLACYIFRE
ncbi:hypothetical protein FOIG_07160 [Fusarium odoratissimum NRRL 54006]|uniref:Uncharacterized protein n=2 Tax=Fusarium oxysporum species complex TaxID=171631 RepID=X0JK68_FUSO5|nr:uncharacterized protein FOIG_07160 [Fusarium odoratissimum NRRL 54006]EXM01598.1 hypothetical protein FOIG_07160 [Fusarium odoratissimum NRRL 54006]TXC01810.1 hypothetical protein FocTR4_00008603 [Fusarium oxysporum f. sp. cubense]